MREINRIVVHCTATPPFTPVENIQKYWQDNLGWKIPGYHYIIPMSGMVINLADISEVVNGAKGYNEDSIHIAYVGGINVYGRSADTRNSNQRESMFRLIRKLRIKFDFIPVIGHCDLPDVKKSCPNFNTLKWYMEEVEKEMKQKLK